MRSFPAPRGVDLDVLAFTVMLAPLVGLLGAVLTGTGLGVPYGFLPGTLAAPASAALYARRRGVARDVTGDLGARALIGTLLVTAALLALRHVG